MNLLQGDRDLVDGVHIRAVIRLVLVGLLHLGRRFLDDLRPLLVPDNLLVQHLVVDDVLVGDFVQPFIELLANYAKLILLQRQWAAVVDAHDRVDRLRYLYLRLPELKLNLLGCDRLGVFEVEVPAKEKPAPSPFVDFEVEYPLQNLQLAVGQIV